MKDRKNQFENLANLIRSKSLQHSLEWTPSNYANSYQSDLGNGVILISFSEEEYDINGVQIPVFTLAFINERGNTFHTIAVYSSSDEKFEMLKDIYDSAYDSYMKTDETYRSMMDAIMKK